MDVSKSIFDLQTNKSNCSCEYTITPKLIEKCKEKQIREFYIRSPLTCNFTEQFSEVLWLGFANENLVDIGEAIGILAGQSLVNRTQLTMRTFHTGGTFTSEATQRIISPINGIIRFYKVLKQYF
jgi:DNA-directed RNA polymerase subunit beta'